MFSKNSLVGRQNNRSNNGARDKYFAIGVATTNLKTKQQCLTTQQRYSYHDFTSLFFFCLRDGDSRHWLYLVRIQIFCNKLVADAVVQQGVVAQVVWIIFLCIAKTLIGCDLRLGWDTSSMLCTDHSFLPSNQRGKCNGSK